MIKKLAFIWAAVLGMLVAMATTAKAGSLLNQGVSLEVEGGGLNYQLENNGTSSYNTHKWSPDGRLNYSGLLGVRLVMEDHLFYNSLMLYGGNNGIGQPVGGLVQSSGFKIERMGYIGNGNHPGTLYVGWAIGGYLQNDNSYKATTGQYPNELTAFGSEGLVPILGLELDYKVPISDSVYIKLDDIIQPSNINTALSLGYTF